jgi:hypothetical protein
MALSVTQFLHSAVSRLEAEERLTAAQQDGSFLVRQSESIPGAFTLCMLLVLLTNTMLSCFHVDADI